MFRMHLKREVQGGLCAAETVEDSLGVPVAAGCRGSIFVSLMWLHWLGELNAALLVNGGTHGRVKEGQD